MGNSRSRPARRQDEQDPAGNQPSQQAQRPQDASQYAQYPPPHVYNRQQTPYYRPSNGQAYGGSWQGPNPPPPPPTNSMSYMAPHHPVRYPVPTMPYRPHPHVSRPGQHQQQPPPPPPPAPTQELTQTATIRNAVNLKKTTLKLVPLPEDPKKLAITFSFDASAPCAVSTFVVANEEPAVGCRVTPEWQPASPPVLYEKGLGHKFPGPSGGSMSTSDQHVVDLSVYEENLSVLSMVSGDRYPLIIRLEVISDKGLKQGHTLDELLPGGEQKPWVQSQTTFAAMRKEDDGSWSVSVIKQKIWVEGISYELQEIYGLEHASKKPAAEVSVEDAEERLCVICLVNPRDTTVLPCRHMCMCYECAQELRKQSSKCPICRNHVESLLHIKMSKLNKKGSSSSSKNGRTNGESSSLAPSSQTAAVV